MRKNKPLPNIEKLEITALEFQGKGVARHNGKVIFVEQTIPGDIVDVQLLQNKKDFAVAKPIHFHQYAADRIDPFCEHFGVCGGCKWQTLSYEKQLLQKELFVKDAINKIGKLDAVNIFPIIGCDTYTYYRNKLEFTFSNQRWLTKEQLNSGETIPQKNALGFHIPGRFDKILQIDKCWLQNDVSNLIRNFVFNYAIQHQLSFFDLRSQEGFLRNLLIRTTTTGEVMVVLVVKENLEHEIAGIMQSLQIQFPEITSLNYVVNFGRNDIIHPYEVICFYGNNFIIEQLGHIKCKIGPKSFFQTNTLQAKKLYDITLQFADLNGDENLYDLYTGTGSIALYAANRCKSVAGIEQVPEAIADAKENALLNKIDNCKFYVGDMKDMFNEQFYEANGKPDLVITDPPRVGMHANVVKTFLDMPVPKIVYVSCNPTTQARDLQMLSDKYETTQVQPVDMFPQTYHIESVALLKLKQ